MGGVDWRLTDRELGVGRALTAPAMPRTVSVWRTDIETHDNRVGMAHRNTRMWLTICPATGALGVMAQGGLDLGRGR
jgi:hypothetical protein